VRYKVRARDEESYQGLLSYLQRVRANLHVVSPKRRILSTDDLSPEMRDEIRARGGEVHEDTQYGPG
jgi:hypothetical protein